MHCDAFPSEVDVIGIGLYAWHVSIAGALGRGIVWERGPSNAILWLP